MTVRKSATGRERESERERTARLTASVERYKGFGAVLGELDVERRGVCLQGQSRRNIVLGAGCVGKGLGVRAGELVAGLETAQVRKASRVPERIAHWEPVVAAAVLVGRGIVQHAVVVELLAGVAGVDVPAVPRQLVDRVLDGPDAPRCGMLGDANRVAKPRAEQDAVHKVVRLAAFALGRDVKSADLGVSGVGVARLAVLVVDGAARHDKHARLPLGHEKGAGGLVRVAHVGDDGVVGVADGGGLAVVRPGVYPRRRRCVEDLAVVGERQAMV